jgi:hypothetical protein
MLLHLCAWAATWPLFLRSWDQRSSAAKEEWFDAFEDASR